MTFNQALNGHGIRYIKCTDSGSAEGRKVGTGLYGHTEVSDQTPDVSPFGTNDCEIDFRQCYTGEFKGGNENFSRLYFNHFPAPRFFVQALSVHLNRRINGWNLLNGTGKLSNSVIQKRFGDVFRLVYPVYFGFQVKGGRGFSHDHRSGIFFFLGLKSVYLLRHSTGTQNEQSR